MTDEVRFAVQLGLNLIAILLAGWLAGRYAARRVQEVLEAERKRAEEARRQAQAEVVASLPPIPPELEQMVEIERWVLNARDLQVLLTSLSTLLRIRLCADRSTQRGMSTEVDRSLKSLGRRENKWLNDSLPVVAYVRKLDPAKGKTQDQSLETWISRLNQAYVQAAQSLRRAASLCEPDGDGTYGDTMINAYLAEADQAAANMASMIASALDRIAYFRQQLPKHQAQQIAAEVAERLIGAGEIYGGDEITDNAGEFVDPTVNLATSASQVTR
jgi:hypothetical protein